MSTKSGPNQFEVGTIIRIKPSPVLGYYGIPKREFKNRFMITRLSRWELYEVSALNSKNRLRHGIISEKSFDYYIRPDMIDELSMFFDVVTETYKNETQKKAKSRGRSNT